MNIAAFSQEFFSIPTVFLQISHYIPTKMPGMPGIFREYSDIPETFPKLEVFFQYFDGIPVGIH